VKLRQSVQVVSTSGSVRVRRDVNAWPRCIDQPSLATRRPAVKMHCMIRLQGVSRQSTGTHSQFRDGDPQVAAGLAFLRHLSEASHSSHAPSRRRMQHSLQQGVNELHPFSAHVLRQVTVSYAISYSRLDRFELCFSRFFSSFSRRRSSLRRLRSSRSFSCETDAP